jgi:hypothetical protein
MVDMNDLLTNFDDNSVSYLSIAEAIHKQKLTLRAALIAQAHGILADTLTFREMGIIFILVHHLQTLDKTERNKQDDGTNSPF